MSLPKEDWGSVAAEAARQFAAYGYPVMELEGGYAGWVEHDLPVESQAHASV